MEAQGWFAPSWLTKGSPTCCLPAYAASRSPQPNTLPPCDLRHGICERFSAPSFPRRRRQLTETDGYFRKWWRWWGVGVSDDWLPPLVHPQAESNSLRHKMCEIKIASLHRLCFPGLNLTVQIRALVCFFQGLYFSAVMSRRVKTLWYCTWLSTYTPDICTQISVVPCKRGGNPPHCADWSALPPLYGTLPHYLWNL